MKPKKSRKKLVVWINVAQDANVPRFNHIIQESKKNAQCAADCLRMSQGWKYTPTRFVESPARRKK
jgi:hypothetical protein